MNRNACVRYLPDGEKNRTRELWTEAFPEDSRQFLDSVSYTHLEI